MRFPCSVLAALLLVAVCTGAETLENNEISASLKHRYFVLACTAPEIVRRGDEVTAHIELTNRSDEMHVLMDRWPQQQPDGRFFVFVEHDSKRMYLPYRGPGASLEPKFSAISPGETVRANIGVTPILPCPTPRSYSRGPIDWLARPLLPYQ